MLKGSSNEGSQDSIESKEDGVYLEKICKGRMMTRTLYEQIGGEAKLRQIIETFIDRVFEDRMIGFFFRNADSKRIKEMEFQLIARFLGADVEYQGRPLDEVHAKHPIMGGQFARRLQVLRETLEYYEVPKHVRDAWIEHTENLRPLITRDAGSDCDPILAREKVQQASKDS